MLVPTHHTKAHELGRCLFLLHPRARKPIQKFYFQLLSTLLEMRLPYKHTLGASQVVLDFHISTLGASQVVSARTIQKFYFQLLSTLLEMRLPYKHTLGASQVVLVVKNPPVKAGIRRNMGSIPGSGRSPGGGNGNPLQYSCQENSMDRGSWQATAHGVTKSRT